MAGSLRPNPSSVFFGLRLSNESPLPRKQGIDTQALLGHATRVQTDRYNDVRGKEWIKFLIVG
ncbi:hypothetical protein [Proteus hauseri]|uniref:hypothetical protein n=1 Tax=Proteus hauseri TaxID=183417 RepID=UPI003D814774